MSNATEISQLRAAQSAAVYPHIPALLDAWDMLPNDIKTDPELKFVAEKIEAIDRAMESPADDCQWMKCDDCEWEGVPYSDPDALQCIKCGSTYLRVVKG